jgi:uncharacterized protein (TIGR02145 family)
MLSATGLVTGTYKVYAVDASVNLSGASADNVTIFRLVDIDGNVYSTVVIGTQHWMAENLKVTKYRNGVDITNITTNAEWDDNESGAYGVYANDETTYLNSYGRLYNWYALDNITGILCPEGWHVPSRDESDALSTYLGLDPGGKMKETGTAHWNSKSAGTDNSSGFNARGSGVRLTNGGYSNLNAFGYFWTTRVNGNNVYFRYMSTTSTVFGESQASKKYGFSVRCLED